MGIEEVFAYDTFRPGQRELARRIYLACLSGEILVTEATSGFGKTAAVLSGTLTAAEETDSRIIYACRTKRQISRVVEEVARLQGKHRFSAASVLSKYDYCLLKRDVGRIIPQESFGWYCWFNVNNNLCSYFLNVPLVPQGFSLAVNSALTATPSQVRLVKEADSIHVCPYEVARLAVLQARLAIVPYQYVFDPQSTAVIFNESSVRTKSTILVVDEAHNLRDFYRGLHSATLSLEQIMEATLEAESMFLEDAAESLKFLSKMLERETSSHAGWLLDRDGLLRRLQELRGSVWLHNLAYELSACSAAAWESIISERRLPSAILKVGEFLTKLSTSEGAFLVKWDTTLGLLDSDPVAGLAARLHDFKSSVLLSATINPSAVFLRSLGLNSTQVSAHAVPVEPQVVVKTAIDSSVSTRYKLRTPEMFSQISDKISAIIGATAKGVGVFPSSYAVLGPLFEMVSKNVKDRHLVSEKSGLSNQEATDLFDSFRSTEGSVLFAVQGGRFSEGEDFAEELMGSVIVVGLSLPPPSPMLYAEYTCLKRAGETEAFLMLSRLPAARKAFQAAGRHIRRPGKRGLVFLLDDRFGSGAVRGLMPSWLKRDLTVRNFTTEGLSAFTKDFWNSAC